VAQAVEEHRRCRAQPQLGPLLSRRQCVPPRDDLDGRGLHELRWATFNGIKKAGGSVRKGEHGTKVILWKPIEKKDAAGEVTDKFLLLRGYTVFNVEQADWPNGIPADGTEDDLRAHDENEQAEALIADYSERTGVKVTRGGDSAHYSPMLDSIALPLPEAFDSGDAFYGVAFHEVIHSTGHESRLNRIESTTFGSEPYAMEELVAELGSAMLGATIGLEDRTEASASYIASWLRTLRDDKKFVIMAAAKAQRAADLVLGTTFEKEESDDDSSSEAVAA
jgi:antirestriction protein ArdC